MATEVDLADVCRRYGSSVLRRARAILNDAADGEDAAQEVLLMIMTKGRQFRGESEMGTWIYRLTTNLCLNRLRDARRRSAREQRDEVSSWLDLAPRDPYDHVAARSHLRQLLGELDALSQRVFVYKYLDGLTQDEIAAATGKSRRTVGKRLQSIEASVSHFGASS